jgi:peptidoglycan/xylan/chitin deacetylase (PgdA/CDA1 family)
MGRGSLSALVLAAIAFAPAAAPAGAASTPRARPKVRYRAVGCRPKGGARAIFSGPERRAVAIGFDDGPSSYTPAFLRMLERAHVRATFFMVGDEVTRHYRPTLRRELRDGDVLGDHTWSHPDLRRVGDVRHQIESARRAIFRQTGYRACVFRPPYGGYDDSIVQTSRALGMATVLWNVDPTDWGLPGTAAIEQRVLAQVRPGSIIISHDGGGPRGETLAAYPHIIAALRHRGYRIETIPQLLGFRTVYKRCSSRCDGRALRGRLPRGSIVLHG